MHGWTVKHTEFISIHAPLAGRDAQRPPTRSGSQISIHAPLAGRDYPPIRLLRPRRISIHAPLAGRDCFHRPWFPCCLYFNPRAPCGARPGPMPAMAEKSKFQSTRPLRGATATHLLFCLYGTRISIHAPLAGRDQHRQSDRRRGHISIHAPLAGRDLDRLIAADGGGHFNPRAPCGARLVLPLWYRGFRLISIHAPLAGRDWTTSAV